ncbi:sigma-70 family RNA polymerase sigma factor [Mucilaginibacter sp. S1162]|uniref:Sigma-70 family RNA polymerase sigma factor n=2 Tax=Mucilaginibacter humi TaxID=2732510 RepID=A0ABX1W0F9_9SPHI|nr:sigma-70 family RNA polymerase sigma factor [Mucilaginibacter humi]
MPEERESHIISTIKAYGKNLLGFIRKRVKSDADAEDILQDVWYQFSNLVNSEPIEQTGAWLYKVARNKITDKHKKKSETLLDDLFGSDDESDDDTSSFKDLLMPEESTPETAYMRNIFWEQLFSALDELPEEQKQVFIWQEMDDMTFREISELTGVNVNTLVSRKRYAVLHLRDRLQQLYKEITQY